MKLVFGLGNPGPEYEWTRHNVGFHVVERLARTYLGDRKEELLFRPGPKLPDYRGPGAFSWVRADDPDALLVRPETWMNRSGTIVEPLVRWAGAEASDVFVVYDDLDLDLGRLRIRPHGGHGGHNGMRSILECLDSDRFPRLRIGIGRSGTDAARHVLERFAPGELADAEISVAEAADAIRDWLVTGDIEGCMTRFHSRWNQQD